MFYIVLFILLTIYDAVFCFESNEKETLTVDTGRGSIGLYLSDSQKHLPVQRQHYHFRIHHHYHNRDKVLKEVDLLPRDITICEGNPGSFCPNGTWALCTKNSAIRCITSLWSTEMCLESFFSHCVKISLPCAYYTPECGPRRFGGEKNFSLALPCISIIRMFVNLTYVNGTAIAQDLRKIYPPDLFCVTVLALPDEITKGEELFDRTSKVFGKFAIKALGVVFYLSYRRGYDEE